MPSDRDIYLDYSASAPLSVVAQAAVEELLFAGPGNPSSIHRHGQEARERVETARDEVAAAIGAEPSEIVFTSGATEANALAWSGATRATPHHRAVTTAVEHPSNLLAARSLRDWHVDLCPVDGKGRLDRAAFAELIGARCGFVSAMVVNNETGVVFPVDKLAGCARAAGAVFHCDATQALGRLPIDVQAWDVDLLSISGHKAGALPGVGALYVRYGTALSAIISGHQEDGLRGGTENIAGIVSFGAAMAEIPRRIEDMARQRELRNMLRDGLMERIEGTRLNTAVPHGEETGHILNVSFEGIAGQLVVIALDVEGIAVSSGAACASGTVEASHVLTAMGDERAIEAVRFSMGLQTSAAEIEETVDVVEKVVARIRLQEY